MPEVAVLVPWRPDPQRQRIWEWVHDRYRQQHPDWEIVLQPAPDGPWRKACAVNTAARACSAGTVIVADADVWAPNLQQAVDLVHGGAGWVIPHRYVHRLTEQATKIVLEGGCATDTEEHPYFGVEGGGIVVLPRETLLDVPMDERFCGWGQEDQAWGIALHFLIGPAVRLNADLTHLWHPPQPRDNRKIGSLASFALHRRYLKARHDPDLLRDLLKEATQNDPEHPDQPAVSDRHAHR